MIDDNRDTLRNQFYSAWENHQKKLILSPLENQLVDVIQQHPEYQTIFSQKEKYIDKNFDVTRGEINPFMHMSLHLALQEQLSTHRPQGVNDIYNQLCQKHGNPHEAQHQIMEIIGDMIWLAQRENKAPDETVYLHRLKQLTY